jgi:hypothetical protein
MKCNETLSKWCKNKHRASKIIDTFETYQWARCTWSWEALVHPHEKVELIGVQTMRKYDMQSY